MLPASIFQRLLEQFSSYLYTLTLYCGLEAVERSETFQSAKFVSVLNSMPYLKRFDLITIGVTPNIVQLPIRTLALVWSKLEHAFLCQTMLREQ